MINFKMGDRFVVESDTGDESHTFYSIELLVRFLRAQRAGTSWAIRQFRLRYDITPPNLFPQSVLDAYKGMY